LLIYTETEEQYNRKFGLTHKAISLLSGVAKIRLPLNSGILSMGYANCTNFDPVDGKSKYFFGETFYNRLKLVKKIKSEFSLASGEVIVFALRFRGWHS